MENKKLYMLASAFVFLAACAPGERLPDDPDSERTPVVDDGGGSQGEPTGPGAEPAPTTTTQVPTETWPTAPTKFTEPNYTERQKALVLAEYNSIDPMKIVPTSLLEKAILYFHYNKSLVKNKAYLSVIDFSKSSSKKRFFIINMASGSVWAIHVAHGKGSDSNHDGFAERFSNTPNTEASSLGVYLASESYTGKYGLSIRLDGLSATNSNARERAIVIHPASYVQDREVIQGRSWGCPAVSAANRDRVVQSLRNGSLIYAGLK